MSGLDLYSLLFGATAMWAYGELKTGAWCAPRWALVTVALLAGFFWPLVHAARLAFWLRWRPTVARCQECGAELNGPASYDAQICDDCLANPKAGQR